MRELLIFAIFAVLAAFVAAYVIIIIQDERAYRRLNSRLKRKEDINAVSEFYDQYHPSDEEEQQPVDLQQEDAQVAADRE